MRRYSVRSDMPSSCAAFAGPERIEREEVCRAYTEAHGLADRMGQASHIVWATGGSLVPQSVREELLGRAPE